MASISRQPRSITSLDSNLGQEEEGGGKKRKPFSEDDDVAKQENGDYDRPSDEYDHCRPSKVLILNQSKCNRIAKFPCTIGEANELLMKQLVTVKFSFNSSLSSSKDFNGNYDELPLISPDDLKVPSIKLMPEYRYDGNNSQRSSTERVMENQRHVPKQDNFDKSVQILYQKIEQRSLSSNGGGRMLIHQFIAEEVSPKHEERGAKLCQICHKTLRRSPTIKCVDCDFKCHAQCQNLVSAVF